MNRCPNPLTFVYAAPTVALPRRPLASMIGARRDAQQVGEALSTLSRLSDDITTGIRIACLEGLFEGLQRGRQTAIGTTQAVQALRLLLASRDPQVRSLAVHIASQIRAQQMPEMQLVFDQQQRLALDDAASAEVRKRRSACWPRRPLTSSPARRPSYSIRGRQSKSN